MKTEQLADMSAEELGKMLTDKKAQLREQRFQKVVGKLENTGALKQNRKQIARIKTRLRSIQNSESKAQAEKQ